MRPEEKYHACVDAVRAYVEQAGFTDVVIGLSGGIDSALVATLCVDAFGAQHVHGVLLPGPYSSDHSIDDALQLAENLGVGTVTIPITEAYQAFDRALGAAEGFGGATVLTGLAAENTQARCRMVVLMALANSRQWLMINTGNKSEAMMGYSTLYGDTAGAFAPLGGLYKTDVYALSRWCNARAEEAGVCPPIPANTLTKAPSAELSADQEDERSMGIAYDDLDRILIALVEEGKSVEEVAQLGFDRTEVERIQRTKDSQAFKRALEPPYPQVRFY